ncbi:MAG: hypothetical protein C0410_03280 [Anaerolinea sp.]|nr:hypothetical protein [Anaerolinea sp.]
MQLKYERYINITQEFRKKPFVLQASFFILIKLSKCKHKVAKSKIVQWLPGVQTLETAQAKTIYPTHVVNKSIFKIRGYLYLLFRTAPDL